MPVSKQERQRVAYRKWYQKNKEKESKRYIEYQKRMRAKARELLGNCCSFCERSDRTLVVHEKSGIGHRGTPTFRLVFKNPENFVLLCRYWCHTTVHNMMSCLGVSWGEIEKFLEEKKDGREKKKKE